MAVKIGLSSKTSVDTAQSAELEVLQAILTAQGKTVSCEEVASIGYELLGFFEAFGEDNEQDEGVYA